MERRIALRASARVGGKDSLGSPCPSEVNSGYIPSIGKVPDHRLHEPMQPGVYLETAVVSHLTARPSRDLIMAARQEITREVWHRLRKECERIIRLKTTLEIIP